MNRTMITATNTMNQLQNNIDMIGHNIANSDTNGYKRKQVNFTDLLFQQYNNQSNPNKEVGRLTPNGVRQGVGSKLAHAEMVLTQGQLQQTDRSLDIAFTKQNQFYKVLVQENDRSDIRYSRDGALFVTPVNGDELMLVNGSGYPVLDEKDNMIVFSGDVSEYQVSKNGRLLLNGTNGQAQTFDLGIIEVKQAQFFENKGANTIALPNDIAALGVQPETIFTEMTAGMRGDISIEQRMLEKSNVDMGKEMAELMNVQRAYQFQSRSVSIADQMMGLVNGIR